MTMSAFTALFSFFGTAFVLATAISFYFWGWSIYMLQGRFKGSDTLVIGGIWAFLFWGLAFWFSVQGLHQAVLVLPNEVAQAFLNSVGILAILLMVGGLTALAYYQDAWWDVNRRRRGQVGERQVAKVIEKSGYKALHDVYVAHGGDVAQIDHLVVVGAKILVIETKNYVGGVFGRPDEATWTRKIDDKDKVPVPNPLWQNARQVRVLRDAHKVAAEGLVVFARLTDFPMGFPDGTIGIERLPPLLARLAEKAPGTADTDARAASLFEAVMAADQAGLRARHRAMYEDFLYERPSTDGDVPVHVKIPEKPASDPQIKYGRDIANRLGIKPPESLDSSAWNEFIATHKPAFEEAKRIRRAG